MTPEQLATLQTALADGRGAITGARWRSKEMNENGILDGAIQQYDAWLERNARACEVLNQIRDGVDPFIPVVSADMLWSAYE